MTPSDWWPRLADRLAALRGTAASLRRDRLAAYALVPLVLALLLVFAGQALLYDAADAARTPYHEDVRVTGGLSREDGALVLPEWASSLNATGPVTLDIKLGDLDAAAASLEAYLRSGRSLSGLVFRLDASETDVGEYNGLNSRNMQSLLQLLNQTEEFDRLETLEVQYRDAGDAANLRAVQLRGEELRAALLANYAGYAGRRDDVVNLSERYDLDTAAYEQSVLDFQAIVEALTGRQEARAAALPAEIREIQDAARAVGGLPPITFEVVPARGGYGDVLEMRGTVSAPAGTGVTIFADGRLLAGVVSGADGRFRFPYRVERIEAGRHAAYASAGAAISEDAAFTIDERNTTLDLAVSLENEGWLVVPNWTAYCTGVLETEDGVPVRDVPVEVDVEEWWWNDGTTGEDGAYRVNATNLEPGRQNLTAWFYPDEEPLNWTVSAPVELEVPSLAGALAPLLYLAGLGLAGLGAVLYLRRRRAGEAVPARARAPPPEPVVELPPAPTPEEAAAAADLLGAGVDGRETITRLYRRLARELDSRHPREFLQSFTPRELAARFAAAPWSAELAALVAVHERVRYAGRAPTEEDIHLARETFIRVISESEGRADG
jgi:hypothetical protein